MSPLLVRSLAILLIGWTAACVCGFGYLWAHSLEAGETGAVPAIWPADSAIAFPGDRSLALVFIHPQCPCTRATLAELRRTIAASPTPVRIVVVAVGAEPSDGADLANVSLARSIDGAEIFFDEQGEEAARFGAMTSGHAFFYSPDGRLQFQGGITASRGHEGPSAGASAIRQILVSEIPATRTTAVFGCSLLITPAPISSANPSSRTPTL